MRRVRAVVVCALMPFALSIAGAPPALAAPTTPAPAPSPPIPPVPGTPGGSAPPSSAVQGSAEDVAIAQARASGVAVEVLADRSPVQQIFAQPDGTLSAQLSAGPVRVPQKGGWLPVDPTLRAQGSGFTPAAVLPDLTFGGAGSTTVAQIGTGGKSLTMTWPTALPVPAVSGSVATYPDVLPGVDLRLQAAAEGYSEQLVVKTAAAAANPALRTISFGLSTTGGLTVRTDGDGSLVAVDAAGGVVLRAPAPAMWDTPTNPDAVGAGVPGPHRAEVAAAVVGSTLQLTPDPAVLSAPDLSFPLVIDPSWTTKAPAWTEVNSFAAGSATWRTVPTSLALGFQDFQSPSSRVRSFIRFPISSTIYGAQVRSATLRLFENWSSSCTKTAMQVYATGSFSSATTWNHQPAFGTLQGSATDARGHDAGCPSANLEFPVANAVAAAAKAHGPVTLGLKAANENDHLAWKKFQIDGTSPQLTIVYNRAPKTPVAAELKTQNPTTPCGNVQANAQNGVLLTVKASDPDADKVRVVFSFTHVGGSTSTFTAPAISSGGTASWQIAGLGEGQTYTWKAYVRDVDAGGAFLSSSAWSPTCTLVENASRPNPPEVVSNDFPEDTYGPGNGRTGTFELLPGAVTDTDVVGYTYSLDGAVPVPITRVPRTLVTLTPPTWGPHDLIVQAKDTAGNLSSAVPYHFWVKAPTDAAGYWKLDDGAGTTAASYSESDPDGLTAPKVSGTLQGGTAASWTTGRLDGGLHTDGTAGSVTTPAKVNTAADLTVSAWVRLSGKTKPATVVSEDSTGVSGFLLQYRPEQDRFAFTMPQQDSTSTLIDIAWSTSPVPVNTWTHLTGVYWAAQNKLGIYVNGGLEGTATHTTPWNAVGTVQIGRGRSGGVPADFWPGDVDEVRAYGRSLADGEISDIVNHTKPGPVAQWRMDDPASATTAADVSGLNHPLTRGTGNTFTAGGHDLGALSLTGANPATGPAVVDTSKTFSVGAWLRPSSVTVTQTALSQVGPTGARFALAVLSTGKWVFNATSADAAAHTTYGVQSTSAAVANQWAYVAATWDATSGTSRLYVNGRLEGSTAAPVSWNAATNILVGSSKGGGAVADRWTGLIDEVRVYDRVLYAGEPADLYHDGRNLGSASAPDGRWRFDEATGATVAADSSGRNRPAALTAGAAFLPTGGHAGGALQTTVTPDATDPTVIATGGSAATANAATRTDRSFAISVWVRLDDDTRDQAVVTQDGVNTGGFTLALDASDGLWTFTMPPRDAPGAGQVSRAQVAVNDGAGAWVHLFAGYDSFTRKTELWVVDTFGSRHGYGDQPTPWQANGPLRVGRARTAVPNSAGDAFVVGDGDWLAGSVDDLTLFTGSLSAGDRKSVLGL